MNYCEFLPWQKTQAQQWLADRSRLAHACLVHGQPGAGQQQFAQAAAASLLCQEPVSSLACGHCQACHWVLAGNHPDLLRLRPDAVAEQEEGAAGAASGAKQQASREIRIDQIRSLLPWCHTAAHRGGAKVALIYPAEALNIASANALLKLLEEPPGQTVLILVADDISRLLPTIVSRCQRLPVSLPDTASASQWLATQGIEAADAFLAAAGGAPMLALEAARSGQPAMPDWMQDFIQCALNRRSSPELADRLLATGPVSQWLPALQRLWCDLILASWHQPLRYYPSWAKPISQIASDCNRATLAAAAQWLQQQQAHANHPLNARFFTDYLVQTLLQALRKGRA